MTVMPLTDTEMGRKTTVTESKRVVVVVDFPGVTEDRRPKYVLEHVGSIT